MSNLDLDINNYQIKDLEIFFRLREGYNEHDISQKENEIRTLLLSSGHIESHFKRDIIIFLDEAKKNLIQKKIKAVAPSTIRYDNRSNIPNEYPLPNTKIPTREENIIIPKETQYTYQKISEYFPGKLNPLDTRILQKCLSIDSRFVNRDIKKSDFIVSLPNRIEKVVSMECSSIEIATQSLYNISQSLGNNYIYVSICAKENEYSNKFIVPDGHYNKETLLSTLNRMCSQLCDTPFVLLEWKEDPYSSGNCIVMITPNEDAYYLEKINHITLDFTMNINGDFEDYTNDIFTRMGYLLGFTKKVYSGKMQYMGEIPINVFSSLPYFYLSIDDYQNKSIACFQPSFSQITSQPSQLARISINPDNKEINIVSIPRKFFGPVDITRLQIRLLDPYGKNLHLDTNFSFCLIFDTIYDL